MNGKSIEKSSPINILFLYFFLNLGCGLNRCLISSSCGFGRCIFCGGLSSFQGGQFISSFN